MGWLVFSAILELAYLPVSDFVMYQPPAFVYRNTGFSVEMQVEAKIFGFLFVGGSARTYMWLGVDTYMFYPERMLYGFVAGVRASWFEMGFRHYCTHPVTPYFVLMEKNPIIWEGAYEEIYIRIKTP
jgi:hypothetical protein